jgi:hypothetical protein
MVIFNDPVPVENPALQAVLMALDMRTAIRMSAFGVKRTFLQLAWMSVIDPKADIGGETPSSTQITKVQTSRSLN